MNRNNVISTLLITFLAHGFALEAPCYGYGSNFGVNINYMENDYMRVVAQNVGNSSS